VQKHNKFLSYNLLIWEIYFLPFISCGIKKYFKVHYIFSTMQYTKWENLIVNIADLNADDIHVETENHLKSSFLFHLLLTFVHVQFHSYFQTSVTINSQNQKIIRWTFKRFVFYDIIPNWCKITINRKIFLTTLVFL